MPSGGFDVVANATKSPAEEFSVRGVEATVRAIQSQRITYRDFREPIVEAGCVGYFVFLTGRRGVCYGRGGDSYVEPFPAAK